MSKKTVKVSIKLSKLVIFFLMIVAVIAIILFLKTNSKKTATNDTGAKEIIMPRETGVADSGFELKNTNITALNAKTIFDALEEIYGKQSLKIYFLEGANTSVKIGNYINNIERDTFYRLSFWARINATKEKNIQVSIGGENGSQNLGIFSSVDKNGVQYYEFNFQAESNASDLIFTSTDGNKADAWIDDVAVEKINVESAEQLKNIKPTISGNTARFNIDQGYSASDESDSDDSSEEIVVNGEGDSESGSDSGDFFATPNRKMGQIFQPTQPIISNLTLKIQKVGMGGTGEYHLQIREYDEKLGVISNDVIATRKIYTDYPASFLDQIKDKEQQMTEEFDQNESDIKEGRKANDPTVDQYPPNYTQQQIDESKAQKRKDAFALAVVEMKENFNVPYELNIPISVKLDTGKKYWIGIDSAKVKPNKRNYIKVFLNSQASASENEPGFISKEAGAWKEYSSLWFKTFYPKHTQIQGEDILSGATISDYGDKLIYRYQFNANDYSSLSGFPGRKIYDLFESNFKQSDESGNYTLSFDQYATYKFNTVYPVKKITIQGGSYHQSLEINFSNDGENWREVYSKNPAENNQSINPTVIIPEEESAAFYLRIKPAGNDCTLFDLSLDAELEK